MKILHLEDNDLDAELIRAAITREWPECTVTRVSTREEFEQALAASNVDLVLSDHELPSFSGIAALDIAHEKRPDLPFIFLSGTIGEQRAIEALRHGADDYILKDARARLVPAIRGAIQNRNREQAKRQAEEELQRSQEDFQEIAESIDNFIVLIDNDGKCFYTNPAYQRLVGPAADQCYETIYDPVHEDDVLRVRAFLRDVVMPGHPRDIEYRVRLSDGRVRHLEARVSFPKERAHEMKVMLIVGRDETERKAADERLHEQASLLEKARDAICVFSINGIVTLWNDSAARVYGRSPAEMMGTKIRGSLFRNQTQQFQTAFALTLAVGEWHGEFHLSHANGQPLVICSTWSLINGLEGRPTAILCIDSDVTERKQRERELQRAQRLESLGMLAGGIAHDLNNLMSPILMSVGLLRMTRNDPSDAEVLATVEESASSGADLIRQILLFARGGEGERTEFNLAELLTQMKPFLRTTLRRVVELQVSTEPALWTVSADATQIKQVVLNLCLNARDACAKGGVVRVTVKNEIVIEGSRRGFHGEIPAGRYLRLSVADTGSGIPAEILDKIFDPFFTTKEVGKGTGLGLATIAGIVQSHEGSITVDTEVGSGTTFHVYLPALE